MINCIYFPLSADQHTFPFNNLKLLSSLKGSFPKSKTVVPPFFFFFRSPLLDLFSSIHPPPHHPPPTNQPPISRHFALCPRSNGPPKDRSIKTHWPVEYLRSGDSRSWIGRRKKKEGKKERKKEGKREEKKVSREFAIERSNRADNAASHLLADSQIRWRR